MAKDILILAEHANGKIKNYSFELAGVAKMLAEKTGGSVHALVVGKGVQGFAGELGKYGVAKVHVVDSADFENYNPEVWTGALEAAAKSVSPAAILGTASVGGKDVLPRVAARLGAGYANDCVEVKWQGEGAAASPKGEQGGTTGFTGKKPLYAGKVTAMVSLKGDTIVATVRPNSYPVPAAGGGAAEVMALAGSFAPAKYKVKEVQKGESNRPDLTEAEIIVSGGRAMKEAANFKILNELADAIGPTATVGASRAAVDSGYAPHAMQVGQTGKTVSPKLYIACGISGAIQHLAGMRTSKVIVAINKDKEAPIFTKADYGIVGDLFQVVPALAKEFKKLHE